MDELLKIIKLYLEIFPKENNRQKEIVKFIEENENITDWNNFKGHIVVGGFIYAKKEKKFLLIYHKDLKMYLYPGGHIDKNDFDFIDAIRREIFEETGLTDVKQVEILNNKLIPIDIDTHVIQKNEKLNLPEHYHFEFRYLFEIEEIKDIIIDNEEVKDFKWIDIKELKTDINFGKIYFKLKSFLEGEI